MAYERLDEALRQLKTDHEREEATEKQQKKGEGEEARVQLNTVSQFCTLTHASDKGNVSSLQLRCPGSMSPSSSLPRRGSLQRIDGHDNALRCFDDLARIQAQIFAGSAAPARPRVSSSHLTPRWREPDSNYRLPVAKPLSERPAIIGEGPRRSNTGTKEWICGEWGEHARRSSFQHQFNA
jgi:hypothetical protein